jgi:LCP family protein required for cell wall assembly
MIALLAMAMTVTALLAVALGEVARVTASIDRTAVSPVLDPPSGRAGGGDDAGPIPTLSFLVVGVDGVDGTRDDGSGPRNVLADSMIIVRTTPTGAEILPLPRDLWGEIPGHGEAKLNAAMAFGAADGGGAAGGQRLLIETIRHRLGLEINHYVQVDFAAFVELIDDVGGIDLHIPAPARDTHAGLEVDGPGCVHLDGEHAFRLARSRFYDALVDGEWERDPSSELGRIRRQQVVLRAALTAAIDRGLRNPVALRSMVTDAAARVTLDDALTLPDLLELAQAVRSVDVDAVTTFDLAVVDAHHEGQAALDLVASPENEAILERFRPATGRADPVPTSAGATPSSSVPASVPPPTTTAPPAREDPLAPFTPTLC